MTASVPPDRAAPAVTDREAAEQQVAEAIDNETQLTPETLEAATEAVMTEVWPLICQAREDGRREAAEAIEARLERFLSERDTLSLVGRGFADALIGAINLARGAQQPGKESPDGK